MKQIIDDIDIRILNCLIKNSRQNASAISKKVNLSVSAVIERIKKMEAAGIIEQYTLALNHKKIGKDITAFISVSLEHPKFNEPFSFAAKKNKHIIECHYITGNFDFLLKVITDSTQSLEQALTSIKSITGVSLTRTLIVLSTIKNDFSVLPDEIQKRKSK